MSTKPTVVEIAMVAAPIYAAKLRTVLDGTGILQPMPGGDGSEGFEASCRTIAHDSVRHARVLLEAAANG